MNKLIWKKENTLYKGKNKQRKENKTKTNNNKSLSLSNANVPRPHCWGTRLWCTPVKLLFTLTFIYAFSNLLWHSPLSPTGGPIKPGLLWMSTAPCRPVRLGIPRCLHSGSCFPEWRISAHLSFQLLTISFACSTLWLNLTVCDSLWDLWDQQSDKSQQGLGTRRQLGTPWLSSWCWFKLWQSDPMLFLLGLFRHSTIRWKLFCEN